MKHKQSTTTKYELYSTSVFTNHNYFIHIIKEKKIQITSEVKIWSADIAA